MLQRSLIAFWALGHTIVLATNACDAARALGYLDPSWPFASGNYRYITETTARYGPPTWVNCMLFAGVIAWEALAACFFWKAVWLFRTDKGRAARMAAFTISLMLWAAFMVADEICMAYAVETSHMRLFIAQLVTLVAIEYLRE